MGSKRPVIVPIGPSIAYVELTQGQFALIDSGNAALLGQWNWCAEWAKTANCFYAYRKGRSEGRSVTIRMHRLIVNPDPAMHVDHKNGTTLDNRRSNLREANHQQNSANSKKSIANTSGYKGVSWQPRNNSFVSRIYHGGKRVYLWRGQDPEVGHLAYCEAAKRLRGEFARTA